MNNGSCRWVRSRLPLAAGGELLGEARRQVERHLRECAGCRRRLGELQHSLDALHQAGAAEPLASAASLWPLVARRIRESRAVNVDRVSWARRLALPLAAALLLSTLAGLLATRWDRHHTLFGRRILTVSAQTDARKIRKATIVRPAPPVAAPAPRPAAAPGPETAVIADPGSRAVGIAQ